LFTDRALRLHYIDTDCFQFSVKLVDGEKDVYHVIKNRDETFDFSNSAQSHVFYSTANKEKAGLLKAECPTSET